MKKVFICIILIFSVILTGCSSTNDESRKPLEVKNITLKNDNKYEFKDIDINFGTRYIKDPEGYNEPYILRGTMSIPIDINQNKYKIVLIVHGCHDNNNQKRFDTGFKYLTEYLAQNGYLAISIDINAAFDWAYGDNEEYRKIPIIVNEHINTLKKANKGEVNYGIDLKNKIDFQNMSIIGHSTGGEVIFKIVEEQNKKGIRFKNLLAIAPTINIDTNFNIDIENVSILVPGLDGDVVNLNGLSIYNTIRKTNSNVNLLSATLLEDANHNFFNSEVSYNDALRRNIDTINQISRSEQEKFLQKYTVEFLDICFGKTKENTIYDNKISTVKSIDNLNVINYLATENRADLINFRNIKKIRCRGSKASLVQDCATLDRDTALGINLPGANNYTTDLLNITWEDNGGEISFIPDIRDLRSYNEISMNVLIDGLDELNNKGENQSFTINLTDTSNKKQSITITKNSNILSYPNGKKEILKLDGAEPIVYWSEITPMINIRIPLNLYDELDFTNIRKVSITFDETNSGSLMIESIALN